MLRAGKFTVTVLSSAHISCVYVFTNTNTGNIEIVVTPTHGKPMYPLTTSVLHKCVLHQSCVMMLMLPVKVTYCCATTVYRVPPVLNYAIRTQRKVCRTKIKSTLLEKASHPLTTPVCNTNVNWCQDTTPTEYLCLCLVSCIITAFFIGEVFLLHRNSEESTAYL